MAIDNQENGLTEVHHALLFAFVVKAVIERIGEQRGEEIIRKAVRQYGAERGRRMALRAQANGHSLNMGNYLAYSEYKVRSKDMAQKIVEKVPHARVCMSQCSWFTTWQRNGLLPYGRLYCLEIDKAVVRGFNPDLQIDVIDTQSNGAAQCEFVFHDANLTLKNYLAIAYKKAIRPGKKAILPWEYHLGHLITAMEEVIAEALGETGQSAIDAGLEEFAINCGEPAMQMVMARRKMNYACVPQG
jgi:hypothetical protein